MVGPRWIAGGLVLDVVVTLLLARVIARWARRRVKRRAIRAMVARRERMGR